MDRYIKLNPQMFGMDSFIYSGRAVALATPMVSDVLMSFRGEKADASQLIG